MVMNLFASLEDILSPVGEPKAPVVGLVVNDWDENVMQVAGQFIESGRNVLFMPGHTAVVSQEQDAGNNGLIPERDIVTGRIPQSLYYYKGRPEDASEEIPVLVVEEGKVKVQTDEGIVSLEEHLARLDEGDHEYR